MSEGLRLLRDWQQQSDLLRSRLGIEADSSAEASAELLHLRRGLGYTGTD